MRDLKNSWYCWYVNELLVYAESNVETLSQSQTFLARFQAMRSEEYESDVEMRTKFYIFCVFLGKETYYFGILILENHISPKTCVTYI